MPFDWTRLERDEGRARDRALLVLGVVLTVSGAAGVILNLTIGHPSLLTGSVCWLLLGLATLGMGVRTGRHDDGRQPQGPALTAGSGDRLDLAQTL